MQTVYLITGNLLFADAPDLTNKSLIRLFLEDLTFADVATPRLAEIEIAFDVNTLPVFKYLPFEFKNFDLEEGHRYSLAAHVDINGSGEIEIGDYVSNKPRLIRTGLEKVDIHLVKLR